MAAIDSGNNWYQAALPAPPCYPALRGSQRADVCVIGGGLTGLSAALELASAGRRVHLLEAEQLGWGCSGRNGGQLNAGPAMDPAALIRQLGLSEARRLWALSLQGLALIRQRISDWQIDCDLRDGIMLAANRPRHLQQLRDWQHSLQQLQHPPLSWYDADSLQALLRADYAGAVLDPAGGSLQPLAWLRGLAAAAAAAGVQLHEQSRVLDWQASAAGVRIRCAEGSVQAEQLIIACNAHVGALLPAPRRRFLPVASYIGATRPLGELAQQLIPSRLAVCDMQHLLNYYRLSADGRLLFGGRATLHEAHPDAVRVSLRRRMHQVFPALAGEDFEYLWGGRLAVTSNRAPQFGRIGSRVLFVQGYSGQGLALSGLAGQLLAQALLGRSDGFDLFARLQPLPVPSAAPVQAGLRALALLWYGLRDLR